MRGRERCSLLSRLPSACLVPGECVGVELKVYSLKGLQVSELWKGESVREWTVQLSVRTWCEVWCTHLTTQTLIDHAPRRRPATGPAHRGASALSLACIPSAAPSTAESSHRRELDRPLRHHVTRRRLADPRPSGLPVVPRPSRPGAAEPSPSRATPPRAGRGHLFVRPIGDLSAADAAPARGHVARPALRPAAGPADPGDVTPVVQGHPVPRPADLSSAPVSGRSARRRSGARRPQRRGERGRGPRRCSRPTSASRGLLIGALNVQSLRP